jgi:hypothetical protein
MAASIVVSGEETSFLMPLISALEYNNYCNPKPSSTTQWGKVLVMDAPIKDIDVMLAHICANIAYEGYRNYTLMAGNEGGAMIAAFLAAKYTPREIIQLRATEGFNPIALIEDGQKLTGKLSVFHKRKQGADHKGLRFRDALNALLRKKIGGVPETPVTFGELARQAEPIHLLIKALDSTVNKPIVLSHLDYPNMSVADAVLASCAVQPYIRGFEYTADDGTTHEFYSCSLIESLPLGDAKTFYTVKLKIADQFFLRLLGYGFSDTVNKVADPNKVGDYAHTIAAYRAKPVIPPDCVPYVKLYNGQPVVSKP